MSPKDGPDIPADLSPPPLPDLLVERGDLVARLDGALSRPLTMVTAPAGYGKTVAVAQWCWQRCPVPIAWIELDRDDDDPHRVISRVLEAINHLTGVGLPVDDHWLAGNERRLAPGSIERLAQAVTDCPQSVVVVDGVRVSGPIELYIDLAAALARAVRCGLHVLIMGRCIPPPELIPLQLRGVVAHFTAADLELDGAGVAAVVAAHSGRLVDSQTAEELAARLDGWMVGAVLVAMTRPVGRATDADELLTAASDAIEGYATTEIIGGIPADVRRFLLQTACVGELSAELCDRLTQRTDSADVLRSLRIHGLPIFRGASAHDTYRYQRPFRAVLDARFQREDASARAAALRLAAAWYSDQRRPFEAAWCWVRLGEWGQVLNVLLLHLGFILENDMFSELAELVEVAPPERLHEHQNLAVACAWVLRMDGRIAAAQDMLSVYRSSMTAVGFMMADVGLASTASWGDDTAGLLVFAEAALAGCDELGNDYFDNHQGEYTESSTDNFRAMARGAALLASAYGGFWQRGAPHLVDIRSDTLVNLPKIHLVQIRGWRATYQVMAGEVAGALSEAREALRIAVDCHLEKSRAGADALYALGEARRLALEHDGVAELFERSLALAEINGRRNLIAAIMASHAHLLVDTGRPDEALALLGRYRAESRHRVPPTLAGLMSAAQARALAAAGDYFMALKVLGEGSVTSATAAVRVAVATTVGDVAQARKALEQWPDELTPASTVRRSLAAAVLHDTVGEARDAGRSLRAGLIVAAAHRLVQPVAEWGAPMWRLLRRVDETERDRGVVEIARRAQTRIAAVGMAPRFTARESVVLAHLDRGLSVPAVAREMLLSVNTVKTYVKSIYRKLGATSRAEALAAWRKTLPSRDGP